jgi:carotenoid 1,2-hydratase
MTTDNVERFCPSSSIAGDVWHGEARVPAYEWWYFDALSQDGRDALVVIFLSNFVFSPRYNRAAMESLRSSVQTNDAQFPALAFCFYRDGRPLFRAINEYAASDFRSSTTQPECHIGSNNFRLLETGNEFLYEVHIETTLRGKRRLQARLMWTLKEGNFFEEEKAGLAGEHTHHWNMVAPRCDVSGEIALINNDGGRAFVHEFNGTGYHDHNRDSRWMPATIAGWQWGRFHFPTSTAVFYRYRERQQSQPITRLYLIQDNSLSQHTPQLTTGHMRRHLYGLRYPQHMQLQPATATGSDILLRVRQQRVVDGSFFYLRFLSEATLETAGNRTQHASGITEQLSPRALGHTWLWWLINMRIGRNGRTAFLP